MINYVMAKRNPEAVLCQLAGPLAIANAETRNGTNYTEEVWRAIESGEDFQEMIENGSFYIGCDHPESATRSSLTSLYQQTAGIVSNYTRDVVSGVINVVIDVLDTPLGRVIAAIAKYGSYIGISTRMHGDIIPGSGGKVDPNSVDFLGADFVTQPSQKASRLKLVLNENNRRDIKLTDLEVQGARELLESSKQFEVLKDLNKEYNKGGANMLQVVNGKLQNSNLLEGFEGVGNVKVGASGYIEDRFGIEHEVIGISESEGLLEVTLHGGEFAHFKPKKAGLLESVLGKKGKRSLLEGISTGSDSSVAGPKAPGTNASRIVTINDTNFESVMMQIEKILGKVAAKNLKKMMTSDDTVGSITVGSDDGLLVEGKNGASVVIKGKRLMAIQGKKVVETAIMEANDSIDSCISTLLEDYSVRRK